MAGVQMGDLYLEKPIIQGGMGIGISRSSLAGAVAREGGMGVISGVQLGYNDSTFPQDSAAANIRALPLQIQRAREISEGRGILAVNLMCAIQQYEEHVRAAAEAGADAIISGAGLPISLPEYVKGTKAKIAPIVSSKKAAELLLKQWDKKYQRTADFIVMEGPEAGGHLGFARKDLAEPQQVKLNFIENVRATLQVKQQYEERYGIKIPLFVAGGIFTREDVLEVLALGADGVQVATRFVATWECDAHEAFKQAYVKAKEEDLVILESPVGMPARALRNPFVEQMMEGSEKITFCYKCIKGCHPGKPKYCISKALMNAVNGDIENGLIFSGAQVGRIERIQTVREVMEELMP